MDLSKKTMEEIILENFKDTDISREDLKAIIPIIKAVNNKNPATSI